MDWGKVQGTINDPNSSIQRKFEVESQYWNEAHVNLVGPLSPHDVRKHIYPVIIDKVNINDPSIKMLDFGCGNGRMYSSMSPQCQYWGIDISSSFIKDFKSRFPNVNCSLLTEQYIDFTDNFFDLVLSYSVFTHINLDNQGISILSDIYRVLKPHGVFIFSVFIDVSRSGNWVVYDKDKLSQCCNEIGFNFGGSVSIPEGTWSHQTLYTMFK